MKVKVEKRSHTSLCQSCDHYYFGNCEEWADGRFLCEKYIFCKMKYKMRPLKNGRDSITRR